MRLSSGVEELWDAYEHLTEHQQRIVYAIHWDGYTEAGAAEKLGVNQSSVHRSLAAAERNIAKRFNDTALFDRRQTVVVVREENGASERGKGLVPNRATSEKKAPASIDRPAASQNPVPDQMYGSPAWDEFYEAIRIVCDSAISQVCPRHAGHVEYAKQARTNRERIARDLAKERQSRRRRAA